MTHAIAERITELHSEKPQEQTLPFAALHTSPLFIAFWMRRRCLPFG